MLFSRYSSLALTLSAYPDKCSGYVPTMGLIGEIGEVAEHVKKMLRDDNGILTAARGLAVRSELGDVLWYAFAMSRQYGIAMHEEADSTEDLDGRRGFLDPAEAVIIMAASLNRVLASHDPAALWAIVDGVARLAAWSGSTLTEVAQGNLNKIARRRDEVMAKPTSNTRGAVPAFIGFGWVDPDVSDEEFARQQEVWTRAIAAHNARVTEVHAALDDHQLHHSKLLGPESDVLAAES